MTHASRSVVILLCIFLLVPNIFMLQAAGPSSARAAPSGTAARVGAAEWTFLVYLVADNNLEPYGIADFNEMEQAGSTAQVNIVVQIDRATAEAAGGEENDDKSNGDWTGTKRYYVTKDTDTEIIHSNELADMEELNMGDPAVLVDFLEWGIEEYPAQRYALILWDHGGAFWGVCWDDTSNDGEGDAITMPELRGALESVHAATGVKMDLIGFDACLMAQVAVLYQLKDLADISCASGYVVPGNGWPYDTILGYLVKNPTTSGRELGVIIASEYVRDYTDREPDNALPVTMTAFDLKKFDQLSIKLDEFAMEMATTAGIHNVQLRLARANTEGYDMEHVGPFDFGGYCMYDVIDFADKVTTMIPGDVGIKNAALAVKNAVRESIVLACVDQLHQNQGAHGLTLYFPSGEDPWAAVMTSYDPRYDELKFAQERYWDDFLHAYHNLVNQQNTPPSVEIDVPGQDSHYDAKEDRLELRGLAYDSQDNPEVHFAIVRYGKSSTGAQWQTATVSSSGAGEVQWLYQLDIGKLAGDYTLYVRAKDQDGSYSEIIARDFSIAPKPPARESIDTMAFVYSIIAILSIIAFAALFANAWKQHRR